MKSEFTLNLMRWASEPRVFSKPSQAEENPERRAMFGALWPEASTQAVLPVLPYSPGAVPSLLTAGIHRVLARYFGITTPVHTPAGKDLYEQLIKSLSDTEVPGLFSQAMADFSELICQTEQPVCHQCVQQGECEAFRHGFTATLPVKEE